MISPLRRCRRFFTIENGSILAYPWWRRVLLVLPVCALLWLAVLWALYGADA
ncbi:hypothetical protein RGU70_13475 [Herbaspirillum sp. RTI4]|uniref:hypothetical protein n=1 Tax=Herbaspirillum sp. RTI4 TaxID=3048640 RepID=UPI002AB39D34|nr:hypothetical protein [Herbaspirillum sp. RTI4]MDY7579324.1 hypothetical protein [Herbaspirillum sp. RTI4]MEA9980238.1 hypothetical protein [Herbaspirillum sp. RTI4]